jgi:hypothetical protein
MFFGTTVADGPAPMVDLPVGICVNVEQWRTYIDSGKPKDSEKNLYQHKSHTGCLGAWISLRGKVAGNKQPILWHGQARQRSVILVLSSLNGKCANTAASEGGRYELDVSTGPAFGRPGFDPRRRIFPVPSTFSLLWGQPSLPQYVRGTFPRG